MKRWMVTLSITLVLVQVAYGQSRAEIAEQIVHESVSNYLQRHGNCPCPYKRAANGSQCGGRSAWSRPGGHSPICYVDDVTDAMIEQYRSR